MVAWAVPWVRPARLMDVLCARASLWRAMGETLPAAAARYLFTFLLRNMSRVALQLLLGAFTGQNVPHSMPLSND